MAYSEGFSPRPKISFGLALSVAHESDAEYFDASLSEAVEISGLASRISDALPDGIEATAVVNLDPGSDSLQKAITSCSWRIEVLGGSVEAVQLAVSKVLQATELSCERVRKGKTTMVDVRPAIESVVVEGPTDDGVQLVVDLSIETLSLRPDEFVVALDQGFSLGRVHRTHQWMKVGGVRCEPVMLPSSSTRRELNSVS